MNLTYEQLCTESYYLQTNLFFQATQFFVVILSITGTILNLYLSITMINRKIFHINLRILLINFLILLLLRSFFVVFRSSTFIYRMITYKDHCSFLENITRCKILTTLASAPVKCFYNVFIAITTERLIAMRFYQRYEKWQCPVALVFLPFTWLEGAYSIRKMALTAYEQQETYKSYCSSVTVTKVPYFKFILEILLLIGVFALLVTTRIISKRKFRIQMGVSMDSLSSRYQIRENMKTSKTMFIATIMFIIYALLNFSGALLLTCLSFASLLQFAVFKEITSFAIAIFINVFLIFFIVRVEKLHGRTINRLVHCGCCLSNRIWNVERNQNSLNQQHMEIIEQIWNNRIIRN